MGTCPTCSGTIDCGVGQEWARGRVEEWEEGSQREHSTQGPEATEKTGFLVQTRCHILASPCSLSLGTTMNLRSDAKDKIREGRRVRRGRQTGVGISGLEEQQNSVLQLSPQKQKVAQVLYFLTPNLASRWTLLSSGSVRGLSSKVRWCDLNNKRDVSEVSQSLSGQGRHSPSSPDRRLFILTHRNLVGGSPHFGSFFASKVPFTFLEIPLAWECHPGGIMPQKVPLAKGFLFFLVGLETPAGETPPQQAPVPGSSLSPYLPEFSSLPRSPRQTSQGSSSLGLSSSIGRGQ